MFVVASLSEPHIDHDNSPLARNNAVYLSIYVSFTTCLSHPGSQDPCTPWNTPCIPVYWCAHMCDLQLHTLDWTTAELLVSAVKIIDEDRQVNAQTYGINGFSLLIQWSCSCPETCQRTCVWIKNDWWAYCRSTAVLWHSYWQRRDTELTTVPACYAEPCRLTMLRYHWHCCTCSYCHNIISSGSPPVFLECTSDKYTTSLFCVWHHIYNKSFQGRQKQSGQSGHGRTTFWPALWIIKTRMGLVCECLQHQRKFVHFEVPRVFRWHLLPACNWPGVGYIYNLYENYCIQCYSHRLKNVKKSRMTWMPYE